MLFPVSLPLLGFNKPLIAGNTHVAFKVLFVSRTLPFHSRCLSYVAQGDEHDDED